MGPKQSRELSASRSRANSSTSSAPRPAVSRRNSSASSAPRPAAPRRQSSVSSAPPPAVPQDRQISTPPPTVPQDRRQTAPARQVQTPVLGVPIAPPVVFEGLRFEGIPEFPQVGRDATHKILALAHLRGPAMSESMEADRPPVRISAVVDRSGSMGGERLELVRRTLAFVVRELTKKDEFGIIAYDDQITEALTITKMDAAGKQTAQAAIQALEAGGCTNLSGGLLAGVDQAGGRAFAAQAWQSSDPFARRSFRRGPRRSPPFSNLSMSQCDAMEQKPIPDVEKLQAPVNPPAQGTVSAVWLFTDGMANSGITDTPGIVRAMQDRMSGLQATSVFTFGYGSGHNEAMLRGISEAANGMYYFIDGPDSIPSAFAECLGGVLSVVAQDLRVEVKTTRGVKLVQVLGRTDAVREGDSSAHLVLKDLYAEEERDMIFEIEVGTSAGEVLAELVLSFKDAQTGARQRAEATVRVERPSKSPGEQEPHTRLDEQRNRIKTAEALARAREMADAGDLGGARNILGCAQRYVGASRTSAHACNADLLEDIGDALEGFESRSVYESAGRKMLMSTEQCHSRQRSSALSTPACARGGAKVSKERYTNHAQKQLKQKSVSILG